MTLKAALDRYGVSRVSQRRLSVVTLARRWESFSPSSTYWNGYMDGAVRSGERAAAEILREL
jgi:hypothetical protein